jgi:hypothetical protein
VSDDADDKPPPLRLVSDNPNAHADRKVGWALGEVERRLCDFAAALLRIMAGSKTESMYLMERFVELIKALEKYNEVPGRGVTPIELEGMLLLPETNYELSDEEWRQRRWLRDHGFEEIVRGALRLAAHKLLGQEPAFGGMHSEDVIERGVNTPGIEAAGNDATEQTESAGPLLG